MENKLINIHIIFKAVVSDKISINSFMKFVFGQYDDKIELTNDDVEFEYTLDERYVYRYYRQEVSLSDSAQQYLLLIKKRPFSGFIKIYNPITPHDSLLSLTDKLYKLCKKAQLNITDNPDIDQLFNRLIEAYILDDKNLKSKSEDNKNSAKSPTSFMVPKFRSETPRQCSFFLAPDAISTIMEKLKQERILFVYSLPGMGKTEIVKYILHNYSNYGYKEAAHVAYAFDLNHTLATIKYQLSPLKERALTANDKLSFLKAKKQESLLIITEMEHSLSCIEDNWQHLSDLHLSVLITVNSLEMPDNINKYNLPPLPFDSLQTLFCKAIQKNIPAHTCKKLFRKLEFHTLSIILLGKALADSDLDLENFLLQFEINSVKNLRLPYVKHQKNKTSILGHLSAILNYQNFLDPNDIKYLQIISCFNGCEINTELLYLWIPDITEDWTKRMIQKGVLISDTTNQKTLHMNRIISELIQSEISFVNILAKDTRRRSSSSPTFLSLISSISNTLCNCWDLKFSSVQLQELSFAVFNTINHHHIRFNTNKAQTHYSREGICWLSYCLDCIHFYEDYGNTLYSSYVTESLLDSYSGIQLPAVLKFQKKWAQIYKAWQTDGLNSEMIISLFDEILTYIKQSSTANNIGPINDIHQIGIMLYHNITTYLDSMIANQKSCLLQPLEFQTNFNQAFAVLNMLIERFFNNSEAFLCTKYRYYVWTKPIDYRLIEYLDALISKSSDSQTSIILLSDVIYFDAMLCVQTNAESSFSYIEKHYRQLSNLHEKICNTPLRIIESYHIATIYYTIIIHKSIDELKKILEYLPDIYLKITKSPEIARFLKETSASAIQRLRTE